MLCGKQLNTNFASLAQSGEHYTVTVEVRGSKPLRGAKFGDRAGR